MARTALITGASSGLGVEFARQLASRGMDLVLVARDGDALAALAQTLTAAHGVACEVLAADLLDPDALAAVAARVGDDAHPVDMLVNNAGFGLPLAFETNDLADEQRHLALHVSVPMTLMHAALPGMLARHRGRILNVASVAAFTPRSTYGAVKRWVVDFSRWANVAYRPRGVTVTAVCPGFTHTNFHERMGVAPGREGVPAWMWLDARDVVAAALRDTARGTAVSIPSLRYKALVALSRVLPDRVVVATASRGR